MGEGEATVHSSSLLHAVTMMTGGVRYSLIMFFGKPKTLELAFDDDMRESDAQALHTLMGNRAFVQRCGSVCGAQHVSALVDNYELLKTEADIGATVEKVVVHYHAPHLRPMIILHKSLAFDSACWSVYNLLNYASHGCGYVAIT